MRHLIDIPVGAKAIEVDGNRIKWIYEEEPVQEIPPADPDSELFTQPSGQLPDSTVFSGKQQEAFLMLLNRPSWNREEAAQSLYPERDIAEGIIAIGKLFPNMNKKLVTYGWQVVNFRITDPEASITLARVEGSSQARPT